MILFIDCYDSFSYNLTHLIASACPAEVKVIHNDRISASELESYLPFVEAIVLGPGPGNPHNPEDSGVLSYIWGLIRRCPVPVFGVCFGYQSMVLAFGGEVERMHPPQHGRVGLIEHDGTSTLFAGIPSPFEAVRYHSLHSIATSPLVCTAVDRTTVPSEPIEMAAEHKELPIFGVQFHPESVLSSYGRQIFRNFWAAAQAFNVAQRVIVEGSIPSSLVVSHTPLLVRDSPPPNLDLTIKRIRVTDWKMICAAVDEFVVLKSSAYPGNWSIIGLLEPGVTPHIRSKNDTVYEGPLKSAASKVSKNADIWKVAAQFMIRQLIPRELAEEINKEANLPFLGGLVGYVSYEGGCQQTINGGACPVDSNLNSDVSFVFVTKAILVDETSSTAYALGPHAWTEMIAAHLDTKSQELESQAVSRPQRSLKLSSASTINYDAYKRGIEQCFESLNAGDSYELCYTTQTQLEIEPSGTSWDLFVQLVEQNPAPYCSYMAFDDVLLATSPERFMSWDHEKCEFRPIKGTVRKTPDMTFEKASAILRTPKEQAENLMIVDLIRHDLGHLLDEVSTPQLMVVEEYHSVFQLVTSVEGKFRNPHEVSKSAISGVDVLSQSLPPGSMTGAPKQRSVELLRDVETQPRGLYSGVHGYWSIDDRGDWSVIIRSLFRSKNDPSNLWRLGAGGAITVLSTPEGEYEEMNTKKDTVLNALGPVHNIEN